jgi:adenylate cyclase
MGRDGMAEKNRFKKYLETKYFGIVLGVLVFLLLFALSFGTIVVPSLELKVLDLDFRMKNVVTANRAQQGVAVVQQSGKVSPDILIVGIDDKSIARLGKWPFPRHLYADLLNTFSRIKNQNERERAVFLDVFFADPDKTAVEDTQFLEGIKFSGRVFLETVLNDESNPSSVDEDYRARQDLLFSQFGAVQNITGDWTKIAAFKGNTPPLKPYGRAAHQYGHANFLSDDDQVFRQLPLVGKVQQLIKEIPLEELTVDEPVARANLERLAWVDKNNIGHDVAYPLTRGAIDALKKQMQKSAPLKAEDTTGDGKNMKYFYVVNKYRDQLIPSMDLTLALEYFNKKLSDIKIVLGDSILIPSPQMFNMDTQQWEPYKVIVKPGVMDADGNVVKEATYKPVPEIRIPINPNGTMLINYVGAPSSANSDEAQTFTVRPFSGYASNPPVPDPVKWPPTKKLGNMLVLVGAFSQGVASDQKPTPFGLMYGVEIHANALNTILTNNFLHYAPPWVNILILLGMVMFTAFMVSRLSTLWSLVVSLGMVLVFFFIVLLVFDLNNYILTLSAPIIGVLLSFLAVVAYRTVFEERDKRRIRDMFGKYVSPAVVDEILQNPPELGGVDKEITVFFSDIRGFTTLSESLSPQELVNHLNVYLTAMTDLILEYTGTLDKYVGDEIMCFWGAPIPESEHALLACKCAVKQIEVLNKMNAGWPAEKRLSIGIGLNTGIMTVGNMGSIGRMNYTLMGDNVNLGARLEGTNKQYMSTIIMSEFTYAHVKDRVVSRELDNIRVKGKNKPVQIYELIDILDGLEPPKPLNGGNGSKAGA